MTHKLCCSVLQCVAVCCSVSHTKSARYHTHNSKLTHKLCCSVLQRVSVCCSVLQCVAHKVCSTSHTQQRVDAQSLPVQRHTKSAVTQTVRRCASESERLCQKVKSDCVRKWSQCVERQQGDTQSVLQCVAVCCNVLQCVERLCQKVKSDFVRQRVRDCIFTKVCTMHTQYILVDLAFITS